MNQPLTQPQTSAWRRRLRFRLSALLLVTTVASLALAFYFSRTKQAERAVESLQERGVSVMFDYQRKGNGSRYSYQVEPPGPSALRDIAGSGFFEDAEWIRLENTAIAADTLKPLGKIPTVRYVIMTNCQLGDDHLAHFNSLRQLVQLDLKSNRITDHGLGALAKMTSLEALSLSHNQIQGKGLQHLLNSQTLKTLFLHDNPISDEHLAPIASISNLEMLGLAGTNVTDDGLFHFASLKKLRYLGLTRTAVTEEGVAELQKLLPKCEIEH